VSSTKIGCEGVEMADWTEREVLGWTLVNTIMKLTVLQTELLY